MEQTTKSGRQVRPTEAGMEYQREMKTKAFNRQLRELNRLTEKIVGDDDAIIPDTGKRELKEWTHCYINLLQTLSDMRTLLTPDQLDLLEKDSGLKSQRTQTLKTQIQDTLEKLRKTEATPSVVSRASRASLSSVRASLKLLQMQDEHQRAALKVKQSAVLKRRQIEQEKQAIKWKEEDLDLEVEFNIVEEKRKALQKFETELEVDMPASTEQTAPTVNVPAAAEHSQVAPALGTSAGAAEAYELHPQHSEEREAPTQVLSAVQDSSIPAGMSGDSSAAVGLHHELNVDAACFKPSNSLPQKQQKTAEDKHMMQGPTDLSDLFAEQRRGRLPALEPEIFQGSVDKFHSWMKAFESFIESRTSSPAERLHYLSRYTGGEARTVIEGFFLLRTSDAYDRAKQKLYDRFGNDFIVASAYRKKLKEWPMIRAGDGKGLRRLADYLDSCLMVSHHVSGLESLSDCNQNNEILRKLPKHIVDKWKRVVDRRLFEPDAGAQPAYPLFGEFVEFLDREARIECGPVDTPERSSLAGRDIQVRNRGLKESARTFISSAASEKETDDSPRCQLLQPVKTQPRWTCKVCGQQHAIDACNTFKAMSSEERHVAVKQYGLCRGCLRPGHIWKECRNRRRCEKCGYSHPTLMHDDSRRSNMTSVKKPADSSNSRAKQSSDVETRATTLKVGVDGDR